MHSNPCQDCDKRYVGCHGKCKEYQNWLKEHLKAKKEARNRMRQKNIGYLGEHFRRNCK